MRDLAVKCDVCHTDMQASADGKGGLTTSGLTVENLVALSDNTSQTVGAVLVGSYREHELPPYQFPRDICSEKCFKKAVNDWSRKILDLIKAVEPGTSKAAKTGRSPNRP